MINRYKDRVEFSVSELEKDMKKEIKKEFED